jgi:hypothetical protein
VVGDANGAVADLFEEMFIEFPRHIVENDVLLLDERDGGRKSHASYSTRLYRA